MTKYVTPHDTTTQKNAKDSLPKKSRVEERSRTDNFKFSFPSSEKNTNNSSKNCTDRAEVQFNSQDRQTGQRMEKEDEQSLEQICSGDAPPFTAKGARVLSSHSPKEQRKGHYKASHPPTSWSLTDHAGGAEAHSYQ